jgi:NAD(P)-dependent dehydrogenase (short-subunit alcohol dehydrogenase family)
MGKGCVVGILDGKTIVVSGVGPGLGREVAALTLRDGGTVVLGARTESKLAATAAELDPSGQRVAWAATDITDQAQCQALVDTALERFGAVHGVVQVAALDTLMGGIMDTPDEDWTASFNVNVVGPVHLVKAAAPALEAAGGGSIVLIGSQSYRWPQVTQIAYASAKGALVSASYYMAKDLGPKGIRVNTVVPTWMWGPPVEGYVQMMVAGGMTEDEAKGTITRNMPLGEIPADEDVAEACVWLCSDRARMITGQSLYVNAGEFPR